ncbi:MAG: hypothetical protein NT096_17635 [Proteobacteria bacterium]|nr:hypothetical protein [Pseudomonadota bacterium]
MKIKDIKEIEVMAKEGVRNLKPAQIRITVGGAVCGQSKGAKETLEALKAEIAIWPCYLRKGSGTGENGEGR